MSEKHTPGPWAISTEERFPFSMSIWASNSEWPVVEMRRIAWSSQQKTLQDMRDAVGFDHPKRKEMAALVAQQEADARLIAAAPELLAALQACLSPDGGFYCTADVERAARAAIAKATSND